MLVVEVDVNVDQVDKNVEVEVVNEVRSIKQKIH
jgi:hypothetical protein